ncbi:MAG: glycosyltransferase family 2 protein [Paludibacter sp.]|nr:glycosyltransferase family 2 protein [Paludibacter sp.]
MQEFAKINQEICVVVPTYNNARFLQETIENILQYNENVIVVDDGSTDETNKIIENFLGKIIWISNKKNKGKGYALHKGFDIAEKLGYKYVITMDSDGQHDVADLPLFYKKNAQMPDCMIIGSRILRQKNMPVGNTFANKFSNFWFAVQTGKRLADTQTGFRLYPLKKMHGMRPLLNRYEAELELLVRSAWRNIKIMPIKINVKYPTERITHFRPFADFLRISILNTFLCIAAVIYGYPKRLFLWIKR